MYVLDIIVAYTVAYSRYLSFDNNKEWLDV